MAKKEIKLCLVYRDMWQSSGKYMPTRDQLVSVAPAIIEMGCFSRVETNGGGFEQINLLYGENPNRSVRDWTQPFNDVGIQTQMLERGLNGIRMRPVPKDVRKLLFQVKKKQGTDIARSFDGLNDVRNIKDSITYAKAGGMIAQAALSVTHSAIHTAEYYINMATELIEHGADEIAIKDMAGIGRPVTIGKMVAGIKERFPDITVQYHGHAGPGFAIVSTLEAVRAGADIVDVGMEPLSWGTGHPDLLTVHAMLEDAGYAVAPINMDAYMTVRSMTQRFIDEWLGYYINKQNRFMNSLLIAPGLPGGMMGSLMADLENNLKSLNKWLEKRNQPKLTQDDLLVRLFKEVEHIWPMLGNPPLVTPYSQYVKNVSLMNVMQMAKGRERFSLVDDNTWDMLLGKSGNLPGSLAPELVKMAEEQGREFFTGEPQSLYPDALDSFRKEMDGNGWEYGEDDEELMELAMHPEQYRKYRSGEARKAFEADLAKRKAAAAGPASSPAPTATPVPAVAAPMPRQMQIQVNGQAYQVEIAYDGAGSTTPPATPKAIETPAAPPASNGHAPTGGHEILAPLEGTFYLTREAGATAKKVGDTVKKGEPIGYIEAMKVYNAVAADQDGVIANIPVANGDTVEEDMVLMYLK
ncbi:MAG: biotin/lipoyl-containing protein [Bacteroidota bacterium]